MSGIVEHLCQLQTMVTQICTPHSLSIDCTIHGLTVGERFTFTPDFARLLFAVTKASACVSGRKAALYCGRFRGESGRG